jgi:hypothetical protein
VGILIEFTDRYGGNPPSWLRVCGGPCEGLGVYVEPTRRDEDGSINVDTEWAFKLCPDCGGSGNRSWFRTLLRIPAWVVKGIPFTFIEAPKFDPHTPRYRMWWMGFKCAYLVDLGLWRP